MCKQIDSLEEEINIAMGRYDVLSTIIDPQNGVYAGFVQNGMTSSQTKISGECYWLC